MGRVVILEIETQEEKGTRGLRMSSAQICGP